MLNSQQLRIGANPQILCNKVYQCYLVDVDHDEDTF